MTVFVNGQFVPHEQAFVSVFDRGFLYGDGLFETMRVVKGKPFGWRQHCSRLQRGAEFLHIHLPFSPEALLGFASRLIAENALPDSLLRLTLTRGVGVRGYSPKGAAHPTLVMSLHQVPASESTTLAQWRLVVASFRLPANEPLAQFKTCNKLPQILARAEADAAGADEAVLCNTDGFVVEGSTSNLFWLEDERVCTAPLAGGILAGVTRAMVLEICERRRIRVCEKQITPKELAQAQGAFLSSSAVGVAQGQSLDGVPLNRSPLVAAIHHAYNELLEG